MDENKEASSMPKQRGILAVAGFASFTVYLLVGLLLLLFRIQDFETAFYFGCVNFFISLPFTFLGVWVYRALKLPSRFELLAAVLIGFVGLYLVGLLISGS